MIQPATVADVQSAVLGHDHLRVRAGGTKPALSTSRPDEVTLDLTALNGLVEYNPSEYTFTAWAGTPLSHIQAALAEHAQYLPFDPPLVEEGATLGGTIAAGLSGPGRYRYGGVRDFIVGVRVVDGKGQLLRGGGKVVKNAAGFDIPKLMVGSLGMFGVMTEVSFKVFPKPPATVTVSHTARPMVDAIRSLNLLYASRADIDALDFEPAADGLQFFVRLRGLAESLPGRTERIKAMLGGGLILSDPDAETMWKQAVTIGRKKILIKVALTSRKLLEVENYFSELLPVERRYSVGGNLLWLSSNELPPTLPVFLESQKLPALVLRGTPPVRLGYRPGPAFEQRIKQVFDPHNRFVTV